MNNEKKILSILDTEINDWKPEYVLKHCPVDYKENKKYFIGYLQGLTRARTLVVKEFAKKKGSEKDG